jgi:hypothetical protein
MVPPFVGRLSLYVHAPLLRYTVPITTTPMKKIVLILITIAILGALGYWYADYRGWLDNYGPDNLPTAEERVRMQQVEESASQIAPNAKAGAGVVPKGSKPIAPPPPPATTTEATTTSATPAPMTASTTTS